MDEAQSSEERAKPASRGGWALVAALVVLALLLRAPFLGMGFYLDDCIVRLVHEHPELLPSLSAWNVYDFGDVSSWKSHGAEDATFPWWVDDDWRIRFFRPLTSASLLLDDLLFDDAAVFWHLTSFAWFAAVLVAAHALYRTLGLSRREALLALGLLAASGASVVPAGWIANRNSVIALCFTLLAVLILARAERPTRGPVLAAAAVCALLAALAKESGVAAFGLIAAFLLLDPRAGALERRGRRPAAMSALALGCASIAALALLGYGTRSAFYATPWHDPGRFLAQLAVNVVGGATSLATPFVLDVVTLEPDMTPWAVASGALVIVVCALGLWRLGRGRRELAFFAAWLALLFLPQGVAPPASRLLFEPSIGSAALLAVLIAGGCAARRWTTRAAAWALFVLAGPLSALSTLWVSAGLTRMAQDVRAATLAADVGAPAEGRRNVFVLQAENALVPFALQSTWAVYSADHEVRFWTLQMGRRAVRWTGVDERTFELRFDEPLLDRPFERVYLADDAPIELGQRWQSPHFEVEALEVAQGLPIALRVRFVEPPRGEGARFLVWRGGRCERLAPPAPGETVELPRIEPADPFVP